MSKELLCSSSNSSEMMRFVQKESTRIAVLISRLTSNVHLTASVYNVPSHFSVSGCFQWSAGGRCHGLHDSHGPQVPLLRPTPQALFLPLPPSSPKSDPVCGSLIPLARLALRSAWLCNLHAEPCCHSANFCYIPIPSMIFK